MFILFSFGVYWLLVFLTSAFKAPAHSRTPVPRAGGAMVVPGAAGSLVVLHRQLLGRREGGGGCRQGCLDPAAGPGAVFGRGVLSGLCVQESVCPGSRVPGLAGGLHSPCAYLRPRPQGLPGPAPFADNFLRTWRATVMNRIGLHFLSSHTVLFGSD